MAFYQGLMQNGIYSLTHSEGLRSIVFKKTTNDDSSQAKDDENSNVKSDGESNEEITNKQCAMTAVPNNIPGGEN